MIIFNKEIFFTECKKALFCDDVPSAQAEQEKVCPINATVQNEIMLNYDSDVNEEQSNILKADTPSHTPEIVINSIDYFSPAQRFSPIKRIYENFDETDADLSSKFEKILLIFLCNQA